MSISIRIAPTLKHARQIVNAFWFSLEGENIDDDTKRNMVEKYVLSIDRTLAPCCLVFRPESLDVIFMDEKGETYNLGGL